MLLALPLIIPLATAAIALLFLRYTGAQRVIGVAGALCQAVAGLAVYLAVRDGGVIALHVGNWAAPFGITLVADMMSAILVLVAAGIGVVVGVFSAASIEERQLRFGYFPLFHVLLMGVNGAFLTGDLFNLYVWFEVMLISSFVLVVIGGEREQLEGAVKYVTMNFVASILFLSGVGIVYGKTGTLNLADLSMILSSTNSPELIRAAAGLFLIAFGLKAGAFPLFSWLPASYHTPPFAVTVLFSALLTKVGVYAMMRVFPLVFSAEQAFLSSALLPIAAITMVTGVLGAVAQYDMRKLLSFHIISQIGYLLFGVALGTPLAIAGAIFFMVHIIAAKSALFVVSAVVHRLCGTTDLTQLGDLVRTRPAVAALFLIPALSLAGIPPLSGFIGKYALIRAGLEAEQYWVAGVALLVGILTLFSMIKIWNEAFWKTRPDQYSEPMIDSGRMATYFAATLLLAAPSVALGLFAEPAFAAAEIAAGQLLAPESYVQAVLGVVK